MTIERTTSCRTARYLTLTKAFNRGEAYHRLRHVKTCFLKVIFDETDVLNRWDIISEVFHAHFPKRAEPMQQN